MPTRIEEMAIKALATKGMAHNTWISHLRTYLKYKREVEILAEIDQITDWRIFNTLIEAGLKTPFREALEKRWIHLQ